MRAFFTYNPEDPNVSADMDALQLFYDLRLFLDSAIYFARLPKVFSTLKPKWEDANLGHSNDSYKRSFIQCWNRKLWSVTPSTSPQKKSPRCRSVRSWRNKRCNGQRGPFRWASCSVESRPLETMVSKHRTQPPATPWREPLGVAVMPPLWPLPSQMALEGVNVKDPGDCFWAWLKFFTKKWQILVCAYCCCEVLCLRRAWSWYGQLHVHPHSPNKSWHAKKGPNIHAEYINWFSQVMETAISYSLNVTHPTNSFWSEHLNSPANQAPSEPSSCVRTARTMPGSQRLSFQTTPWQVDEAGGHPKGDEWHLWGIN